MMKQIYGYAHMKHFQQDLNNTSPNFFSRFVQPSFVIHHCSAQKRIIHRDAIYQNILTSELIQIASILFININRLARHILTHTLEYYYRK